MSTRDLITFYRARLADDLTAAARASWDEWDSSHWTAHRREQHDGRWAVIDQADEGVIPTVAPQAADDAGVAQHIARHDPARVLREVEAKGRLLDWLELIDQDAPVLDGAVRILVLPYADHPDYRAEWRPE